MAAKLYPPQINGTLPAFWLNYDASNAVVLNTVITIPYTDSATVNSGNIYGFCLRLRTASSGTYLFPPINSTSYDLNKHEVSFVIPANYAKLLNEGQYYKVQIAYINALDDLPGYFSTVGIIKCTSKPSVYMNNLSQDNINFFTNEFVGIYDQSKCKDQTEKVYSYEFVVYNENNEVYYSTGEKLHQTAYDTDYSFSVDKALINDYVAPGKTYSIQYKITTINGLEMSSPQYKLTNDNFVSPNKAIEIVPIANPDNGYITVTFKGSIDKTRSFHYIVNEDTEVLINERDRNNNFLYYRDGNKRTVLDTIKAIIRNINNPVDYIKEHNLYKHFIATGSDYQTIIFYYEWLAEDKTPTNTSTSEYYFMSAGRDLLKSITYQDAEDNMIDLDNYVVVDSIDYESFYYGSYLLSRASDEDNYTTWYNIARFRLDEQTPSSYSVRDITIEHGRKYKYALQQYNIWGLISARIISEPFEASFEDMFLYDGDRLLKIRFNPEVNTFKTTILEQKSDTLGGRFPIITRNGDTYYKEFPIGGLIAQEMDEEELFINRGLVDTYRKETHAIEANEAHNALRDYHMFSDENIFLERQFKLAVLDWLNDGKPKLFKSPYEGNYIVRLMNNSLTPIKELGRMLHTFTSQAYEIAECTYDNLVMYGFIDVKQPSSYVGLWRTYNFADLSLYNAATGMTEIIFDAGLESFVIQDMMPGDIVYLYFEGEGTPQEIMIGITGSYTYTGSDKNILKLTCARRSPIEQTHDRNVTGVIHCFYQGLRITAFDAIVNQQLHTIVDQQFIGVNPWVTAIHDKNDWYGYNNLGENQQHELTETQRLELATYVSRKKLREELTRDTTKESSIEYMFSKEFATLLRSFDPGELLDRINVTINEKEAYKVELLKIENMRFKLRELIPVFCIDSVDNTNYATVPTSATTDPPRILKGQKQDFQKYFDESSTKFSLVATSPYGYPHRIEELVETELLDPFCIFQVFYIDNTTGAWRPYMYYYDPYYRTWIKDYDPTFKINYNWKSIGLDSQAYELATGPYDENTKYYTRNMEFTAVKDGELNSDNYIPNYFYILNPGRGGCGDEGYQFATESQPIPGRQYYDRVREPIDISEEEYKPNYYYIDIDDGPNVQYELSAGEYDPNTVYYKSVYKPLSKPYQSQRYYWYEGYVISTSSTFDNTKTYYNKTADTFTRVENLDGVQYDANPMQYYILSKTEYSLKQENDSIYSYVDSKGNTITLNVDQDWYFFNKIGDKYYTIETKVPSANELTYIKDYDTIVNLSMVGQKEYQDFEDINSIHIGSGVLAELRFQIKVVDFYTEIHDKDVAAAKQNYLDTKSLFQDLMKSYYILESADQYRRKYKALKDVYTMLLNGSSNISNYSYSDILQTILNNDPEVKDMKLLKLYEVTTFNSEKLSSEQITQLNTLKQQNNGLFILIDPDAEYNSELTYYYKEDGMYLQYINQGADWDTMKSNLYSLSNIKFLSFTEEDETLYYVKREQDIQIPNIYKEIQLTSATYQPNKYYTKDADGFKISISNDHSDITYYELIKPQLTDDNVTIMRKEEPNDVVTYYAVDKTLLHNMYKTATNSTIFFPNNYWIDYSDTISSDNIIDIVKPITDFQAEETKIMELTEENISIFDDYLILLSDEELQVLKNNPNVISIKEVQRNEEEQELTFYEEELLNQIAGAGQDETQSSTKLEGVEDKRRALDEQINDFNSEITTKTKDLEAKIKDYIEMYNTIVEQLDDYNEQVYNSWANREVVRLIEDYANSNYQQLAKYDKYEGTIEVVEEDEIEKPVIPNGVTHVLDYNNGYEPYEYNKTSWKNDILYLYTKNGQGQYNKVDKSSNYNANTQYYIYNEYKQYEYDRTTWSNDIQYLYIKKDDGSYNKVGSNHQYDSGNQYWIRLINKTYRSIDYLRAQIDELVNQRSIFKTANIAKTGAQTLYNVNFNEITEWYKKSKKFDASSETSVLTDLHSYVEIGKNALSEGSEVKQALTTIDSKIINIINKSTNLEENDLLTSSEIDTIITGLNAKLTSLNTDASNHQEEIANITVFVNNCTLFKDNATVEILSPYKTSIKQQNDIMQAAGNAIGQYESVVNRLLNNLYTYKPSQEDANLSYNENKIYYKWACEETYEPYTNKWDWEDNRSKGILYEAVTKTIGDTNFIDYYKQVEPPKDPPEDSQEDLSEDQNKYNSSKTYYLKTITNYIPYTYSSAAWDAEDKYNVYEYVGETPTSISNFFSGNETQIDTALSQQTSSYTKYPIAINQLYTAIIDSYLPDIQKYNQIIVDKSGDPELDAYLQTKMQDNRGMCVLCLLAIHQALLTFVNLINPYIPATTYDANRTYYEKSNNGYSISEPINGNVQDLYVYDTTRQELFDEYSKQLEKALMQYYEVYEKLMTSSKTFQKEYWDNLWPSDNSNKKGYINRLRDLFDELYSRHLQGVQQTEAKGGIFTDPGGLADIMNLYDDISFLLNDNNWFTKDDNSDWFIDEPVLLNNSIYNIYGIYKTDDKHKDFTSYRKYKYDKESNDSNYFSGITNNNRPRIMFEKEYKNFSESGFTDFNRIREYAKYYYRELITIPKDVDNAADEAKYTTFIFNPLSTQAVDPAVTKKSTKWKSNMDYYNSLSDTEREQVLTLNKTLSAIVVKNINDASSKKKSSTSAEIIARLKATYINDNSNSSPLSSPALNAIREATMNSEIVNKFNTEMYKLPTNQPDNFSDDLKELFGEGNFISLLLSTETRSFLLVDNSITSVGDYTGFKVPQSLLIQPESIKALSEILDDTAAQGIESLDDGIYKEYLENFQEEIEDLKLLLKQAEELQQLYTKQYENYNTKLQDYNDLFENYETIYNSYIGTPLYDFYKDPNKVSLEEYHDNVREAWWQFLDILDERYSEEKARGMYV